MPCYHDLAATPLLQHSLPAPFQDWLKPLLSDRYDPHLAPGNQKRGLLIGMGMTEKQGGSDVLSNTTRAQRSGDSYRLVGHKWFSRCRRAMRIWCWRRRKADSPAFCAAFFT
jgi:putative acyl-CoA dehydrogenase